MTTSSGTKAELTLLRGILVGDLGICRILHISSLRLCLGRLSDEQEIVVAPGTLETDAGMQDSQAERSSGNHGSFKNHERDLVVGQRPLEAAREFGDTVAGADEDRQSSEAETEEEGREKTGLVEEGVLGGPGVGIAPETVGEFGTSASEENEREDLETKTRQHNVDAHLSRLLVRSDGRDSSTDGLQEKRDKVASAEDNGVIARLEATEFLPINHDDASQA